MLEKCVLTILELNWNQRLGHEKTKLHICHRMLTSSTQLQNRWFHDVEWTRKSSKCQKMKDARAKARAGRAARDTKMKYARAGVQHVIPKCQKHVRGVQHVIPKWNTHVRGVQHIQDSSIKYADLWRSRSFCRGHCISSLLRKRKTLLAGKRII